MRVNLGLRARGGRLFEELYHFARLRDPEYQERCAGTRVSSGVAVVDVDSLIAEPLGDTSELSRVD